MYDLGDEFKLMLRVTSPFIPLKNSFILRFVSDTKLPALCCLQGLHGPEYGANQIYPELSAPYHWSCQPGIKDIHGEVSEYNVL